MKILLNEDQESMRRNIQKMVGRELVPRAKEIDEKDLMRDAKGLQIFEGTSEIQKVIIAKNILEKEGLWK